MNLRDPFILFSAVLLGYQAMMASRHMYFGYFKYPRLIAGYRRANDERNIDQAEKVKADCRKTAWLFVLYFCLSAICVGGYELAMFFIRVGSEQ